METFIKDNYSFYLKNLNNIPAKSKIAELTDRLFCLLFPVEKGLSFEDYEIQYKLAHRTVLDVLDLPGTDAKKITSKYFSSFREIHEFLLDDANSILSADPAAVSLQEVISIYPGFFAISAYRFAHKLTEFNVPIIPRMITEYAHGVTGIDIHPNAKIGHRFTIDHGTGIVIGETTIIGNDVKLYQGVTLGALSVEKEEAQKKRHPTIEDNVVIYAGSTVLGGETVIGHDSVIGGNVWLTESVVPYSVVYHKSEVKIRTHKNFNEPINFEI